MAVNGESIENVWREFNEHEDPRGPLFVERNKLVNSFKDIAELPSSTLVEKDDSSIATIPMAIRVKQSPYGPLKSKREYPFSVTARQTDSNELRIAIQDDLDDAERSSDKIHIYILNPDGTIINEDELKPGTTGKVEQGEIEFIGYVANRISTTLNRGVVLSLENIERQKYRKKQEKMERNAQIRRRTFATVGTIALSSGILAGSYAGWHFWIHEPGKADDEKRAVYDTGSHFIDSDGIELDDQTLVAIPKEQFDSIPSFREGDTLKSPRTIDINSEGCAEMTIEDLDGKRVHVGVSEFNPLGAYSVTAYETENKLTVCTTETPDSEAVTEKFAIQLTDSNER